MSPTELLKSHEMLQHTLQSKTHFDGADRLYKMVSVLIHCTDTSNPLLTPAVSGIGAVKFLCKSTIKFTCKFLANLCSFSARSLNQQTDTF